MISIALPPASFDELLQEVDMEDAVLLFQGRAGGYHSPLIVRTLRCDGSVWEAEDGRQGVQLPDADAKLVIYAFNRAQIAATFLRAAS